MVAAMDEKHDNLCFPLVTRRGREKWQHEFSFRARLGLGLPLVKQSIPAWLLQQREGFAVLGPFSAIEMGSTLAKNVRSPSF